MRGARKHTLAQRDPEQHVRTCTARPALVYVLPCRHEDILKVGFSCDPLVRMQTLHPRYFEFFALERTILIGTETVADAREIEGALQKAAHLHQAPAPLLVAAAAGGHTEWYRGAYALLGAAAAGQAARGGYRLHDPALPWLRERLERQSAGLYESSTQLLRAIESARAAGEAAIPLEVQLRNTLDACIALELDVAARVPAAVLAWYRNHPGGEGGRTTATGYLVRYRSS